MHHYSLFADGLPEHLHTEAFLELHMVAANVIGSKQRLKRGMLSLQARPVERRGKAVGPMSGTCDLYDGLIVVGKSLIELTALSSNRCQAVHYKAPEHGGPRR